MKTERGTLYELTSKESGITHRIVCGDSTERVVTDYLFETADPFPSKRVGTKGSSVGSHPFLLLTDPPYGVLYDASWREKDLNKAKRVKGAIENDDTCDWALVWEQSRCSIAYIWHAAKYTCEVAQSLILADFEIINQIIWAKQHFAISRGNYHWKHEPCWYARRKGCPHNWQGSRKESTLWEIPNLAHKNFGGSQDEDCRTNHPTQKPLECMLRPIANNTFIGQGVYDPFLGSGTTLIACEMLDRQCYGVEIDTNYCQLAAERWINYMAKNKKRFEVKHDGVILSND